MCQQNMDIPTIQIHLRRRNFLVCFWDRHSCSPGWPWTLFLLRQPPKRQDSRHEPSQPAFKLALSRCLWRPCGWSPSLVRVSEWKAGTKHMTGQGLWEQVVAGFPFRPYVTFVLPSDPHSPLVITVLCRTIILTPPLTIYQDRSSPKTVETLYLVATNSCP